MLTAPESHSPPALWFSVLSEFSAKHLLYSSAIEPAWSGDKPKHLQSRSWNWRNARMSANIVCSRQCVKVCSSRVSVLPHVYEVPDPLTHLFPLSRLCVAVQVLR